jgi:hypothetical protein
MTTDAERDFLRWIEPQPANPPDAPKSGRIHCEGNTVWFWSSEDQRWHVLEGWGQVEYLRAVGLPQMASGWREARPRSHPPVVNPRTGRRWRPMRHPGRPRETT